MNGFNGLSFQNTHAFAQAVTDVLDKVNQIVSEDPEHSLEQLEDFLKLEDQKVKELVAGVDDWKNDAQGSAKALGELLILDRLLIDLADKVHVSEYLADVKQGIAVARGNVSAHEGGAEFFVGVQTALLSHLEDSHDYIGKKWAEMHEATLLAQAAQADADGAEVGFAEKSPAAPTMSPYNEAYIAEHGIDNE